MRYVVVFPKVVNSKPGDKVLLVKKDRPKWQRGRFNLVGGKIEEGETPEQAALRELEEEAGLQSLPISPTVMGQIVGSWGVVYCVKIPIMFRQEIIPREGETEEVKWHDWNKVKESKRLLPNLKIVIPMMAMGITGWVLADEGPTGTQAKAMLTI